MGQIPNFCACGARLPDGLLAKFCEKCHKQTAVARMTEAPGSISKQAVLMMLDEDVARFSDDKLRVGLLAAVANDVRSYAWDDCSKFLSLRNEILQSPKGRMYRENARTPPQDEPALVPFIPKTDYEALEAAKNERPLGDVTRFMEIQPQPHRSIQSLPHESPPQAPWAQASTRDGRMVPIGFGPIAVMANGTVIIQAQPQVVFRACRLIIPSCNANNFFINDIRVGRESAFAGCGAIPAAAFSELARDTPLLIPDCVPGIIIALHVSNVTNCMQTFAGVLLGTTLQ